MRSGDESFANGIEQLLDMDCDSVELRRPGHRLFIAPGDFLVEDGEIAGRFDIVAERLQRPDDDIAVTIAARMLA